MRGAGIKLLITKSSPASAHLLDVTRTVSRAGQKPTGIDRIERAYITWLAACDTPLFGILRSKLGYLLLDKDGCRALVAHCEAPVWTHKDILSRLSRRTDAARAVTETGLRKIAIDRAVPSRLTRFLKRNLPDGFVYFNIGQTNFNDRIIQSVRTCSGARIAPYVHDTIPLDWPETQTQTSRLKFKRFLARVDRFADLVLCNSDDTKERILQHCHHVEASRINILTPGLPEVVLGDAPMGPWTGAPYFLAIGTIEPRKNIGLLLDLWDEFDSASAPHLLICGRRGWMNEDVFARLDTSLDKVHELNDLSDGALWKLLSESNGLLFPSKAEGFGYPAVEAAHLGVPVVCAPLHAVKNILGDYAIYAETSDRYAWHNNIEQLAQRRRGKSGERLRHRGFEAPNWQAHFNRLFTLL